MRYQSYLNTAKKIIELYSGAEPLSIYLKKFFAAEKKYGSKDRKQIAALCYNYFRLGKAMTNNSVEEKIITGTFLCEQVSNDFLNFHKPGWNEIITKPLSEKINFIDFDVENIFPWKEKLSEGINYHQFCESFFYQPKLFLRIRPGKKDVVLKKLEKAAFDFQLLNEDCIALPNSSKLDDIIELDKDAIVQDYNSQQVLNFLKNPASGIQHPVSLWDCCAASGGKSILAYDILKGRIELTVTDIRESILSNLKKRFYKAGIKNYHSFIADLTAVDCPLPIANCSLIICDVPCTGSGTWSRIPEQLFYFNPQRIDEFVARQQKIVSNSIPQLQKDGLFFYITCSVFKKENEEMVNFIKEKFQLQLLQTELLKGYNMQADTMFAAVFKK